MRLNWFCIKQSSKWGYIKNLANRSLNIYTYKYYYYQESHYIRTHHSSIKIQIKTQTWSLKTSKHLFVKLTLIVSCSLANLLGQNDLQKIYMEMTPVTMEVSNMETRFTPLLSRMVKPEIFFTVGPGFDTTCKKWLWNIKTCTLSWFHLP